MFPSHNLIINVVFQQVCIHSAAGEFGGDGWSSSDVKGEKSSVTARFAAPAFKRKLSTQKTCKSEEQQELKSRARVNHCGEKMKH